MMPDDTQRTHAAADVLGVVMAGGASSRFGSPKALAEVGGVRVVDRVIAALRAVVGSDVTAIVNDAALAGEIGLPWRSDIIGEVGALAGVHAAVCVAAHEGYRGALVVACDMPFVEPRVLQELLDRSYDGDAVLPESTGRRRMEPLCAYYGIECIDAIEIAALRGDARMIGFHADIRVAHVPLAVIRSIGDPDVLFRNLNSPEDHAAAERVARERG